MSRALLAAAAVLAVVLAFVLDVSLLYLLAAVLAVAAGVVWFLGFRGKFDIGKPDSIGFAPPDEDLAAFGILEIRAKAKGRNGVHRPDPADASLGVAVEAPRESGKLSGSRASPRSPQPSGVTEEESGEKSTRDDVQHADTDRIVESRHRSSVTFAAVSMVDTLDPDVIAPFLQTAAIALGATTVCLLGYDDDKDRHRIHAVISQNAYVRSAGDLPFTNPLPFGDPRPGRVVVTRVSEAKWGLDDLKYYREPISVREVARILVPVEDSSERFLLVVDAMRNANLRSARSRTLVKRFAAVLSTLLEAGEATETTDDVSSESRPRRDIIAEEIAAAREEDRPLALALVMCSDAGDVTRSAAERGDVETELMQKLIESMDGLRVEKFGELMVGVFFSAEAAEVEAWALNIQEQLPQSSSLLGNGVSVGVAMLMDRHEDADELRADAAAALQEAFESGACTILA